MSVLKGNNSNNILNGSTGNDSIYGYGGNDKLLGNNGNDYLYGDTGNDTLDGGSGNDIMYGGAGNDIYYINSLGDKVIEYAGQGTDTVYSSISYVLPNYVENLILTGNAAINGTGNSSNNYILGNNAANIINGLDGNDSLPGEGGNDTIYGGLGTDTIAGGKGNDYIFGNYAVENYIGETPITDTGHNTYIFNKGDGQDFIEYAVNDTLVFRSGINTSSLVFSEHEGFYDSGSVNFPYVDLIVKIKGTTDSIELFNYRYNVLDSNNHFNNINIKFADGSTLNSEQIYNNYLPIKLYGTSGNDILEGSTKDNFIYGYAGNDKITDQDGNDNIDAGTGNDTVIDYTGSDTIYGGDGNDVISSDLLNEKDIAISFNDNDYINGGTGNDQIYDYNGNDTIYGGTGNDTIQDSAYPDSADNDLIYGDSGDDKINACRGNDTIYGGTGNDYIIDRGGNNVITGGTGNDTIYTYTDGNYYGTNNDLYNFNKGDGKDWIQDRGGDDTIKFGSGITQDNLHFSHSGDNLLITFTNSSDSITIDNWFQGSQYYIEDLQFADGSHLTANQINSLF